MATSVRQVESASLRFANVRAEIDRAEEALLEAMKRHGYSGAACFAVRLAVEEAVVNGFLHGHKGLGRDVPIELVWTFVGGAGGGEGGGRAGGGGI
jgi:anti-sigma regulatory factor (Ser/Thr protein kinase)